LRSISRREIALDLATGEVGRFQNPRTRRVRLGQLPLDDLALAQRMLGRPPGGDVEDRAVEPAAPVAGVLRLPRSPTARRRRAE
jgi:hypothetical protein